MRHKIGEVCEGMGKCGEKSKMGPRIRLWEPVPERFPGLTPRQTIRTHRLRLCGRG